ncbi:CocE/NonD family hydrolase [Candidatus Amarobacter glycogenicus]|uniref:CocE/NonD family hydrolase n=1 Tax=Candidatus Amarobacter glycogenicus TaxID=3140699 RepID=UPI003136FBD8|nr:CocE/NonD family hydrolase [Dehalococcoidia bacterium]
MTTSIRIDHDVPMQTRDGVTLRADVFRPDDGSRYPALLTRTPYGKHGYFHHDFVSAIAAAREGFAVVIQDTRGRFASDGDYVPGIPEGDDSYDAVEWVASQPWCDGAVGMYGASYGGRVQWEAAIAQPPSLRAIAPGIADASPINWSERQLKGAVMLEDTLSWLAMMVVDIAARTEAGGGDASALRAWTARAGTDLDGLLRHLPLRDALPPALGPAVEQFGTVILDPLPPGARPSDLLWNFERVAVPCLHSGGWYDLFAGSTFIGFGEMRKGGGSSAARQSQHLICGPWGHNRILPPYQGGLNFGTAAGSTPTGSTPAWAAHLAFFDRYLRGRDVHLPGVRYFVMGADQWREGDDWPLPGTQFTRFFLASGGNARTAAGDGVLTRDAPGPQPPDRYIYDPHNPVPTTGGRLLFTGKRAPGPLEQGRVEVRDDVLCYTTPELTEDLEVTGPVILHLFASTSAVDTDFMAKLVDVYPNGAAFNIAEGLIRARYREGIRSPKPVVPGEVTPYVIDLAHTSIVFKRGHRIRLDITSSNFPEVDRNMNTGNPFGVDAEGIPALQTVYHDDRHPSYLELPVIPVGAR